MAHQPVGPRLTQKIQHHPTARAEARKAVLAALPTAKPETAKHLAAALPALVRADGERAEARKAVLTALPTANPEAVRSLVAVLRSLSSIQPWLGWLANNR